MEFKQADFTFLFDNIFDEILQDLKECQFMLIYSDAFSKSFSIYKSACIKVYISGICTRDGVTGVNLVQINDGSHNNLVNGVE